MDKRQLTRRAAIGAAVGSLVAAPFIIRALKTRKQEEVPKGKYQTKWEEYVTMLDVPVKEIEGPPTVTLDCRPHIGMKQRVLAIDCSFGESATFPEPPVFYLVTEGQVEHISPIVTARPALLITTTVHAVSSRVRHNQDRNEKCVAVVKDGLGSGVDLYDIDQSPPVRLLPGDMNAGCWRLAKELRPNYPRGRELHRSVTWTLPELAFGFVLAVQIVGFAEIAGRETMKIAGKTDLSSQELQSYIAWMARSSEEKRDETWRKDSPSEETQLDQKRAVEEQETRSYQLTDYVDLKTGFTVRRELSGTIRTAKPKSVTTGCSIFQACEC